MRERQAKLTNAKALRVGQTDAELRLWYYLRAHRLGGFKFKRQVRLGQFIVDFACLEAKLVIELDGGQHLESEDDIRRDHSLKERGYRVLRFWNHLAMNDTKAVLEIILSTLKEAPLPNPSPASGRGAQDRAAT